jgi:hypothetical protein
MLFIVVLLFFLSNQILDYCCCQSTSQEGYDACFLIHFDEYCSLFLLMSFLIIILNIKMLVLVLLCISLTKNIYSILDKIWYIKNIYPILALMVAMMFLRVLFVSCITFVISLKADKAISPIKNLESSLAASAAKSTVIAVKNFKLDHVILLCTTPSEPSRSKLTVLPTPSQIFQIHGIHLNRYDDDDDDYDTILSPSARWSLLSPTCFSIMTGFSPDVSHLTKVAAKYSASHEALQSQSLPTFKLVRSMSTLLQRETQREGARPFGIQGLWIGWDSPQRKDLQLYTCDPTGLYRHLPSGIAVIGRGSTDLHPKIIERVTKETTACESDSTLATLQTCIKVILHCSEDSGLPSMEDWKKISSIEDYDVTAHWEAIYLYRSPTTGDLEANTINADFFRQIFRDVISSMQDS